MSTTRDAVREALEQLSVQIEREIAAGWLHWPRDHACRECVEDIGGDLVREGFRCARHTALAMRALVGEWLNLPHEAVRAQVQEARDKVAAISDDSVDVLSALVSLDLALQALDAEREPMRSEVEVATGTLRSLRNWIHSQYPSSSAWRSDPLIAETVTEIERRIKQAETFAAPAAEPPQERCGHAECVEYRNDLSARFDAMPMKHTSPGPICLRTPAASGAEPSQGEKFCCARCGEGTTNVQYPLCDGCVTDVLDSAAEPERERVCMGSHEGGECALQHDAEGRHVLPDRERLRNIDAAYREMQLAETNDEYRAAQLRLYAAIGGAALSRPAAPSEGELWREYEEALRRYVGTECEADRWRRRRQSLTDLEMPTVVREAVAADRERLDAAVRSLISAREGRG